MVERSELQTMGEEGKGEGAPFIQERAGPVAEEVPPEGFGTTCCTYILVVLSVVMLMVTFPFSMVMVIKVIPVYERAIIFRLGRIKGRKASGPGVFYIIPCIDKVITVDTRLKTFDVPPQSILSKDSVTVHVDAIVNYSIFNPVMAVNNIYNADAATQLLAQTILRNILGSHKLSELLELRETIQQQLQQQLDEATDQWGVKVEMVLIKDVRIPRDLQRSMAAEAEASREAKAKVIAANGELNAARALKEAAETISKSSTAMQLRYLQTLNVIAAERGSTIIFPLPIDILGPMAQGLGGGGFPPVQVVTEAEQAARSFI